MSAQLNFTGPAELDQQPVEAKKTRFALSLFWRTFFLIGLLVVGSVVAWLQTPVSYTHLTLPTKRIV